MKEYVYISGPMRGHDDYNFPAFFEAETKVRAILGDNVDVCNPAREDVMRFNLSECLKTDPTGRSAGLWLTEHGEFGAPELRQTLSADMAYIAEVCTLMIVLPGWEESKGARAEVALAEALGIEVVTLGKEKIDIVDGSGETVHTYSMPVLEEKADSDCLTLTGAEIRTTSTTGGEKGVKLAAFDQVSPEVEMLVAEHFGKGARKYAAHNFRRGYEWSKSYSALRRHLAEAWMGNDYDVCPEDGHGCQIEHPETGEDTRVKTEHGWTCYNHTGSLSMVAVIWHAMVLTEFYLHHKEFDDRYVYTD